MFLIHRQTDQPTLLGRGREVLRIFTHRPIIGAVLLLLGLGFQSSAVWADCTVTQDDGGLFTDTNVTNCHDYYPVGHACKTLARSINNACARLDMFMAVDWEDVDMINNAHRGVWAMQMPDNVATAPPAPGSSQPTAMTGPPENSIPGVKAAADAGWRTIEYDIFLARNDGVSGGGTKIAVMGHYADMDKLSDYNAAEKTPVPWFPEYGKATTNSPFLMGGLINSYDNHLVTSVSNLRERSGKVYEPAPSQHTTITNLKTFMQQFSDPNSPFKDMVVVFDPKYAKPIYHMRRQANGKAANKCIGFCDEKDAYGMVVTEGYNSATAIAEMNDLLVEAVRIIELEGELGRVVFKLPQAMFPHPFDIKLALPPGVFEQVLFAPQPDAGKNTLQSNVLPYMDNWVTNHGWGTAKKNIAFWDTAILSDQTWMGKLITISSGHNEGSYTDLTEYIKHISNRRSAIWASDLSGPGGRHGNFFQTYTHYAAFPGDRRNDLFQNLYLRRAANAVITTDRPDNYLHFKQYMDQL